MPRPEENIHMMQLLLTGLGRAQEEPFAYPGAKPTLLSGFDISK